MKLSIFLTMVFTANIMASVYSQQTKFSLDVENQSVRDVLKTIESESMFRFFYNDEFTDLNKMVTFSSSNETIDDILSLILDKTTVSYRVLDNNLVVITPKSLMQQLQVSGLVTDATNDEPLPGVYVVIEGTNIGAITDADGKYTIQVTDLNTSLKFSYVGYISETISTGGQSNLDVRLSPDVKALEEVVVIGYGTVKKSDLTGSVVSVNSNDLNQGAITSVDQALQGRIAGAQITQTSSEPGGGMSIRIRGASSINAGNEPLYVIDGLPIDNSNGLSGSSSEGAVAEIGQVNNVSNPLNALNPNDIQSIEILKDASATAIYGSRGANGVILITTKKGSEGGIKFSYNAYGGVQSVAKKIDVLSTSEYIKAMNDLLADQGLPPRFSTGDIATIGAGTDWQDEIFTKAIMQSHNLSMSGGVQKTKFYVSLNYFDQDGVVKETGTKRYIARINVDQQIGSKLKFGVNLNTSRENSDNYIGSIQTNESAGPVYCALFYDPTAPIYEENGKYYRSPELTINNPLSMVYGITSKTATNRMFGNLTLDYSIIKDLSAKINVGFDTQSSERDLYNSTKTIRGEGGGGYANIAQMNRSNMLVEYTMNYLKEIGAKQSVNILGGVTYQNFGNKTFSAGTAGFPSDDLVTDNLDLGNPDNNTVASHRESNTLLSYLGRINYSLSNFLLTASVRADGSSRFGANNKYGVFPSFALGWKLSDEAFIPDIFNTLKLRASWGKTGNQEIGDYESLTTYYAGGVAILDGNPYTGTVPSRIANPDLKWEATAQTNIGIDFGILSGRFSGSIDYFKKHTTDMLLDLPLPTSSGYSSILKNVGSMDNSGIEFMISSTNIHSNNFTWKTTVNFSAIKNKVVSLGELDLIQTGYQQVIGGNTTIIKPGLPLNAYYGYNIIDIFQDQADIDGWVQPTAKPGYPKYQNVNGDNMISTADQMVLGDPFPDFTYGINNSLTYKNLELSFFFQGQQGAELLNSNAIESMFPANATRNRFTNQIEDRWTVNNPGAKWPSGINTSSYGGSKVNNLVVEDASYFRLKSLRLDYHLPVKFWGIQSANIYVLGQNLFTITNYTGYDPEANAFGQNNVKIDYSSYPLTRTWTLGLNVQF